MSISATIKNKAKSISLGDNELIQIELKKGKKIVCTIHFEAIKSQIKVMIIQQDIL